MGSSRSGFKSFICRLPAIWYYTCWSPLCSEPWLLQLQEGACLSGLQYPAECEMKAGQPLECRDRCVPDSQGGQPGHPHHCCPCLCLLREGLKKCSLEKGPMSLHIPFPRLAMLFQADFSLPWVPPGLIKSLSLCEVGQCCRKGMWSGVYRRETEP